MLEIWKPVPGFESHYEASDQGRIRSVPRVGAYPSKRWGGLIHREWRSIVLKPKITGKLLYPYVCLSVQGKTTNRTVHSLVCETFHGPRPEGTEAAHWNDDKADNRAENLRWATPIQNAEDKRRNGGMNSGTRNGHAKLTEAKVSYIRSLGPRANRKRLAAEMGVSPAAILFVVQNKTWKHVS